MSKAIAYRSKKAKGKRLELKVSQGLRLKGLDKDARPMIMSGAAEGFKTDIFTKLPFAIECKNQERVQLWQAWEQAQEQRKPFKDPVLMISGNYRPIIVVMDFEDWLNLVVEAKGQQS